MPQTKYGKVSCSALNEFGDFKVFRKAYAYTSQQVNSMRMSYLRWIDDNSYRPLIMLLESNGVTKDVFLDLQEQAVKKAKLAMDTPHSFTEVVEVYALGHSFALGTLAQQLSERKVVDFKGFRIQQWGIPGFLQRVAQLVVSHVLRDLKHHARIPLDESYTLVGVADEWDWLEDGEVYGLSTNFLSAHTVN